MSGQTCQVCGEAAEDRCSVCKEVFYCNAAHQKADWKKHKKLCVPSGTLSVKGFLLPAGRKAPEVIAVQLDKIRPDAFGMEDDDETNPPVYYPKLQLYLGGGTYDHSVISRAGGYDAPVLDHWLHVYMRDNFFNDGSPPNMCVRSMVNPSELSHNWKGDLLVLKNAGVRQEGEIDARPMDVNPEEDLQTIKNWLKYYGSARQR